ncbi:MAG: radical SAM protein [Patescibacteria group bacterium]
METVLLNPKPALWSVCISCQVGCGMGCTFCATGKMGFIRNMTAEEICDQILFWRQYIAKKKLPIRVTNIVYMGMGEPFANKEKVFESIRWLTDKNLYGFGQRHLSISTSGIVPGIREFADTFPQLNLAVSLHAPNDALRETLMPVARTYPLSELMKGLDYYVKKTNRQVFIEYILLKNIND